jgi:hypothetical protein
MRRTRIQDRQATTNLLRPMLHFAAAESSWDEANGRHSLLTIVSLLQAAVMEEFQASLSREAAHMSCYKFVCLPFAILVGFSMSCNGHQ